MSINRLSLLLPLVFFGCATAAPDPVKQVGPDTYSIRYIPGRHGSRIDAEDRVLLQAAETTLQHNDKYFAIIGIGDEAPADTAAAPDKTNLALQNVYGIYGVGGTVVQPASGQLAMVKKGITIKCFTTPPTDLISSNAAAVERDIKKKYSLP